MSATFLVENTFEITGRGLVIAGQILDGTLRVGDRVGLPDGSGGVRLERVTGVEAGHGPTEGGGVEGFVGLVLGDLEAGDAAVLRARITEGLTLAVNDA